MIRMRLQLKPPFKRRDEVISALRVLISRTQVKPGCLDCLLTIDEEKKEQVIYEESWMSWQDMNAHIQSDAYRTILELMEVSSSTPVLQFEEPGAICGIEYVQKIRLER